MKKGYKRLLLFEILLFLILILNSFIKNIFNRFSMVIFLFAIILIFKKIFGVEKEKKRYLKDILYEIVIVYFVFFILYYLLGVFTSFYINDNYFTWFGFREILLPAMLFIVLKEYLRYLVLAKSEDSKILYIFSIILFSLLELTTVITYSSLGTKEEIFNFVALNLLPALSMNIVANYVVVKCSYKVNIFWLLIIQMYGYILPIIPNTGDYILSLIRVVFPFVIFIKVRDFFDKETDEQLTRDYNKRNPLPLIFSAIFVFILVYFTSGYFKYYAVAIASGSMKNSIEVGDVVIIEKLDKFDSLEVDQIIAYKYNGVVIVHRIINIIELDGKLYFYTQGDANESVDAYPITEDMIVGQVNLKIPYIGLPTVWFSRL